MRKRSEVLADRLKRQADEVVEAADASLDELVKMASDNGKSISKIEELSGELASVIRREQETPPGGHKTYDYPTIHRHNVKSKELRPDLLRMDETVWIDDVNDVWMRVKPLLRVGTKRSHHGHLSRALDNMRKASFEVHQAWITVKLEVDRWELANEATHAAMWSEATRAVQHEKEQGIRAKAITDTDIRTKAAALYPDQWAAQEYERKRYKLLVEQWAGFAKHAADKADDIKIALQRLRG